MPIAAVIKGQTYAVHSDHLNTPRKLTQPDGQVAWQWAYSAFGDEQPTIGAKRFTSESTNPTTGATSIPEVTFNLRYPGQYFDKETKLHYNYFRSYAPGTGRYTQGDPIGLDGGWNRFAYVGGNPLSYTDPTGLIRICSVLTGQCWDTNPPPIDPELPIPPPITFPNPIKPIKELIEWCTNSMKNRCEKVKDQCIAKCTDETLPTRDYGASFRVCYNRCMLDNGCQPSSAGGW